MDMRTIRGLARLAIDGVTGVTDIVEGMHANIAAAPLPLARKIRKRTRGITGLVYESIRTIAGFVGDGADQLMALAPAEGEALSGSPAQEAWRAAINGVLGDHLEASGNPLAIPMSFRRDGKAIEIPEAGAIDLPSTTPRILLLAHGLCMNDLQFRRDGHDHGEALARDLGYTPVYLHYNTGRHVSINGRELAAQLEELVAAWPVEVEAISILGHSLGGLVARSACHYARLANHAWPRKLKKIVFLGTPHHGAPLERHGNWFQASFGITPYSASLAALGKIRSAGVTDLRHGSLLDEDWNAGDRFAKHEDVRKVVPLPENVECFAAAATLGRVRGDLKDRWLADGLVPVWSALGQHKDPDRTLGLRDDAHRIYFEASHWDLLSRPDVYEQVRDWLDPPRRSE